MGVGKLMVQSMKDTPVSEREETVGALWSLCMIPEVANEVMAFGGAEQLVEILISGKSSALLWNHRYLGS